MWVFLVIAGHLATNEEYSVLSIMHIYIYKMLCDWLPKSAEYEAIETNENI